MSELRADRVTVILGGVRVLWGVDAAARSGASLAVTGPAGAGKTTLLHVMGGFIRPRSGRVTLDGAELAGRLPGLGFVPQTFGLAEALTVRENVSLPLRIRQSVEDVTPAAEVMARTDEILERLGLDTVSSQLPSELSGGQQQRAAVARALVGRPRIVIADEPTAELDADNRDLAMELILSACAWEAIVVVASHDDEVVSRCDSLLRLADGSVAGEAP